MLIDMPNAEPRRYRTIRVGKGRARRILHIAIVRKAGRRAGTS
jgi:hypothetical protein